MRASFRLYIAGLTLVLFVFVLALTPSRTESKGERHGKAAPAEKRNASSVSAREVEPDVDNDTDDPDLPSKLGNRIDKEQYLRLRDEYISKLRGIAPGLDPLVRGRAI